MLKTTPCCPKYLLEHNMWFNPLQKIVNNKVTIAENIVQLKLQILF